MPRNVLPSLLPTLTLVFTLTLAACGVGEDEMEQTAASEEIVAAVASSPDSIPDTALPNVTNPNVTNTDSAVAATDPASTSPSDLQTASAPVVATDTTAPPASAIVMVSAPASAAETSEISTPIASVSSLVAATLATESIAAVPVKTAARKKKTRSAPVKAASVIGAPKPAISAYPAQTAVMAEGNDGYNTISWIAENIKDSYNVYWSSKPGVNKTNGAKVSDAVSPLLHTGLTNGTTYYYVVTTVSNGVESAPSAQVRATPIAPGNPIAGKNKSQLCQGCHGEDGNSAESEIPKLSGQYAKYIAKQLRNYQSGARTHQIMSAMAATITDIDLADISAYFAGQPKMRGSGSDNSIGKNLFLRGDRSRMLLACVNCHGVNGKGLTPNTSMFPVIGGQYKDYLRAQLLSFRKGSRTNSPSAIMNRVTKSMTDAEIDALAEYVSGL